MSGSVKVLATGCPTYLRASAREAKEDFREGYFCLGNKVLWEMLANLEGEDDEELDHWYRFLANASDDEIWSAVRAALPYCRELVPARRKATFMRGFTEALRNAAQESPHTWSSLWDNSAR